MRHIWVVGIICLLLVPSSRIFSQAQQPLPPGIRANSPSGYDPSRPPERYPQYTDLDLAPYLSRRAARIMTVQVHVRTHGGAPVPNLTASDFHLLANGKPREVRILPPVPDDATSVTSLHSAPPTKPANANAVVLIILPPNQVRVRLLMLKDAIEAFSARPSDAEGNLAWSISIYDGAQTPYMRKKSDVLAALEHARHLSTPILLDQGPGSSGQRWLDEANRAVFGMHDLSPNRIVVAGNPEMGDVCPIGTDVHQNELCPNPLLLLSMARTAGAQVFIANSGGPSTADGLGALLAAAANTSNMMLTASESGGGYSNSFKDLSTQIDNSLLSSYLLEFHLSPDEIDVGPPTISVTVRDPRLIATADSPRPAPDAVAIEEASLKPISPAIIRSLAKPVASPALTIHQRVDYFPIRKGLAAILPMTCTIEWTANTPPPASLDVIESIEHAETGVPVLNRRLNVKWNGRAFSWERDGQLMPGTYIWRVAAGDPDGQTIASAVFHTRLNPPSSEVINLSTMVAGKSCRNQHQVAPDPGQPESIAEPLLKRRSSVRAAGSAPPPAFDPMFENGCRIEPEPTTHYSAADTLRSFVRIYIDEGIDKGKLQAWSAKFVLHSADGKVETEFAAPLVADSQPGYLAALELPLVADGVAAGAHTLTFERTAHSHAPYSIHTAHRRSRSPVVGAAAIPGSFSRTCRAASRSLTPSGAWQSLRLGPCCRPVLRDTAHDP
jgi:hypothetical protein